MTRSQNRDHVQEALALYPDPSVAGTGTAACSPALLPEESPRGRLRSSGPEALSSTELFALVLGSETRATLDAASRALAAVGGLFGLRRASREDLEGLPGVGEARASALLAAAELGARMHAARTPGRSVISSPADVDALIGGRLRHQDREHFVCVLLDTKHHVLATPTISVGTVSASLVHPREVFKPAIKASAAGVVLVHNHPSGKVEPSREDRAVTRRLVEASETLGIEVLDHLIIGDGFYSMKEHGQL